MIQLTTNLWIKSFDNQLAESLLTASNKRVVNKLSQAIRTQYAVTSLMYWVVVTILLQDINRLVTTCVFLAGLFETVVISVYDLFFRNIISTI